MNKNLILEIRQGIGGNESIFFLKDLDKMYFKFFQKKKIDFITIIKNNKEIIYKIKSNNYCKNLLNESGVHRVQRIPKNENKGKIHTSTCTIFVSNENNILNNLDDKELKIETCKSSGSGGQHVNTTNSAVKVIHIPTNIYIECSDERSQILNKNKAILIIKLKLNKLKKDFLNKQLNNIRKNIISSSERSKKIRTYNYQNNKIINHINNVSYFQLNKILNGDLDILFKN
ncbi:MAG: peptide chain release factor-like protein [Candidatus Carsonella ruddii]